MENKKITFVDSVSTENLVDPLQIGWVEYREGDALIRVKVVRGKGVPFLSHVDAYRKGVCVSSVTYPDRDLWKMKEKEMLDVFRERVGSKYYYSADAYEPDAESVVPPRVRA